MGVHQPRQPQPGQAAEHDARSRRRGRECRARRGPVVPQPDDGLPDRRGSHRRKFESANLDQRGPEPGQPHECVLRPGSSAGILIIANLTGANFTEAEVQGRYSADQSHCGATLLDGQLPGHDLTESAYVRNYSYRLRTLAGQNLTNASFDYATLTGANLTGAEVRGANFSRDADTVTVRLHPCPTLLDGQLPGPRFDRNQSGTATTLPASNLAGQNLTNANFSSAPR